MQEMIKSIQTANFYEDNNLYNALQKLEQVFDAIKTVTLHDLNLAIDSNEQTIKKITDFSYLLQKLDSTATNTDETSKSNEIKGNGKNNDGRKCKNCHCGSYLSTNDAKNINLSNDKVIKIFAEIKTTISNIKTMLLKNKDVIKLPKQFFKTTTSILAYFDGYLSMKYIESISKYNNKATNIENAVNKCETLEHDKIDIRMFFLTFLTSIMACKLQIEKFENLYNNEIFVVDTNAFYSELLPRVQYLEDLTKLTINNLNTIKNKMNNPTNLQTNEKTVQTHAYPSTSAAEISQQHTHDILIQGEVPQDDILQDIINDNSTETNVDDYEFQLVMNMLVGNQ
ncbi:hypothetical protein BDAP_000021 [Binucleata daphniae]